METCRPIWLCCQHVASPCRSWAAVSNVCAFGWAPEVSPEFVIRPRSAVKMVPLAAKKFVCRKLPQQLCYRKMADYYPLISKAVAGLDPDAPSENRRVLYERARAALLAQLRTIKPPFTEAEITRERRALEEAVRKIEEEASKRAGDARAPICSDLVADDLDKAATEVKRRSSVIHANALVKPFSPNEISIEVPSMIVTGGATGRLIGFWRWRSQPSRRVA